MFNCCSQTPHVIVKLTESISENHLENLSFIFTEKKKQYIVVLSHIVAYERGLRCYGGTTKDRFHAWKVYSTWHIRTIEQIFWWMNIVGGRTQFIEAFRTTGSLWEKSTGHRWFLSQRASNAKLWCVYLNNFSKKRLSFWLFKTP